MEDGARTLREQRAAYVGMQEWTSEDVKRGGTAGFLESVPAIIRLPGCFLTERFGAFYVFPCIKEFGMTSEEFATKFLEEERVAAVPGSAFGESGEGYLRISYAYSIENLKEAMTRLARFINKLRNK